MSHGQSGDRSDPYRNTKTVKYSSKSFFTFACLPVMDANSRELHPSV